jgi:hypothetical protein
MREQIEVEICLAEVLKEAEGPESELDEMWSYVGKKKILVGYGMPSTIKVEEF